MIHLVFVRVSCTLCGSSCQTWVSRELVESWPAEWAARRCPAHDVVMEVKV